MWRALKAPCRGYPAETETTGAWHAIPTRDNSGLKQFDPSRALSCQLVQAIFHPFGEEDGAGRCGQILVLLSRVNLRPYPAATFGVTTNRNCGSLLMNAGRASNDFVDRRAKPAAPMESEGSKCPILPVQGPSRVTSRGVGATNCRA